MGGGGGVGVGGVGGGGQGETVTGFIHCPHMVSQYLLIHSKAVKGIIKEI